MNYYIDQEQSDGARFSWNVFPTSRLEAAHMAVPLGAMYTPLKQIPGMPQVSYHPVVCKATNCGTILNPYCRVDFVNKSWVCPFCLTHNLFPHHYTGMNSENCVAEIIPQYTTMEYILDSNVRAPVFLFVIDTCIIEEELKQIKTSLFQSLLLLPPNSLVGLVTFGKNVHVHELSFEECPKSYVFRGDREPSLAHIVHSLGLQDTDMTSAKSNNRFVRPISECEYQLIHILEGLQEDVWNYKQSERRLRCTGTALSVCVSLLENIYKDSPGRIMMFIGGPPTVGPGMIASTELKERMRSHETIEKGNAPFYKPAIKFYEGVATRAVQNGHTIDLFACSLEEVGLAEMKVCVEKTGGYLVLDVVACSFTKGVFIESFKRVFARDNSAQLAAQQAAAAVGQPIPASQQTDLSGDLVMSFNGELAVLCSREFKVCGAIGNVTSLDRKSPSVSETEMGVGQTCAWTIGGLDSNSTLSLYFEIVNQSTEAPPAASATTDGGARRQCYMQFVTKYRHSTGRTHLRVSTISKTFADLKTDQGTAYIRAGFDQEAAVVLVARLVVYKTLTVSENFADILRWLDHILIRLVSKFGTYKKHDPNSFHLPSEFSYYPQFMFHLRRSPQFLRVDQYSLDETAFTRSILLRQNVDNSLLLIQPTMMAYSISDIVRTTQSGSSVPVVGHPVLLSFSSCASDRIIVLDTFFRVVIWYGETIDKWRKDGIHEKPEVTYLCFVQL